MSVHFSFIVFSIINYSFKTNSNTVTNFSEIFDYIAPASLFDTFLGNSTSGYRATDAKSNSRSNLEKAARLLSVNVDELREASVQRVIESHGDKRIMVSDANTANMAVHTLGSTLYVNLFSKLVNMINAGIRRSVETVLKLDPNFETNPNNLFVGILDIFGFEVFDQGNGTFKI